MSRAPSQTDLRLSEWAPVSQAVLPQTDVPTPRFPVVDAHNHLGRWLSDGDWMIPDVANLIGIMDQRHVDHLVNLDGRWGLELGANLDRYDRAHPGRFSTFAHLDWSVLESERPTEVLIESLEESAKAGAKGLKVWKDLGLWVRDSSGELVMPDDPRLVPVWQAAGDLGLPICVHVADPVAFFEPLDGRNERIEELGANPDWWFGDGARYPSFAALMESLEAMIASAPATRIMGAHMGCYAENLDWVGEMLSRYPNLWVDIAGRLAEIGRQPRAFRNLVTAHPERVVFGTDAFPVSSEVYPRHYRFLETDDEYFAYWDDELVGSQGRWNISGADLGPDLLAGLYADNARRWLNGS